MLYLSANFLIFSWNQGFIVWVGWGWGNGGGGWEWGGVSAATPALKEIKNYEIDIFTRLNSA